VIAEYDRADGRGRLVEAAGAGSDDAGLVYVQIAPPASSAPAFADVLLAGVRVR
jgi:eukaryotic-like serine/threonine-protein kinase